MGAHGAVGQVQVFGHGAVGVALNQQIEHVQFALRQGIEAGGLGALGWAVGHALGRAFGLCVGQVNLGKGAQGGDELGEVVGQDRIACNLWRSVERKAANGARNDGAFVQDEAHVALLRQGRHGREQQRLRLGPAVLALAHGCEQQLEHQQPPCSPALIRQGNFVVDVGGAGVQRRRVAKGQLPTDLRQLEVLGFVGDQHLPAFARPQRLVFGLAQHCGRCSGLSACHGQVRSL